jgi:hypothetical protein
MIVQDVIAAMVLIDFILIPFICIVCIVHPDIKRNLNKVNLHLNYSIRNKFKKNLK